MNPILILVVALAAVTVTGAVAWRARERRRTAAYYRSRLSSPDAATRAEAVTEWTAHGLHRSSPDLLDLARREPDAQVRAGLAAAVSARAWEPTARPETAALRRWCAERSAGRTILVTGAGGPAGVNLIRALAEQGHRTIGVDVDPYGAGLFLADAGLTVPPSADPDYVPALLAAAREHGADGLISTMTEELAVLAHREEELARQGLATWFPPVDAVHTCLDKVRFAAATEAAGQPVPLTCSGTPDEVLVRVPGPWIVKPRFGRGSRDIFAVDTAEELRRVWPEVPDPIVQTRLSGREFTYDVLADRDGTLLGGVPRFRVATKSGISTTGLTFTAPGLPQLAQELLRSLGLHGVANIQGFIEEDRIAFTEINPRFSGGLALSLGAGSDLVGQFVAGMYGEQPEAAALQYRSGTLMVRHWQEVFEQRPECTLPALHGLYPAEVTA